MKDEEIKYILLNAKRLNIKECNARDLLFARYRELKELVDKQQKEIENYQILKDDIEGHRIIYVDTPEFEENYISKDKIKEKIEELEKPTQEGQCLNVIQGYVKEGNLILLKELLGE